VAIEHRLHDAALHAAAAAVDDRTRAEPGRAAASTYSETTEGISRGAKA
jgi:hypothetical protein